MTGYGWVRLVHMLAAIVWVGAGVTVVALWLRARSAGHVLQLARDLQVVGPRIGAPASLLLLASGIWMVVSSPGLAFSQTWVVIALAIFAVSLGIGVLFHGPNYKRLSELAQERGESSAEVRRRLQRTFLVTRVEVGLLLVAVLDMVVRPEL